VARGGNGDKVARAKLDNVALLEVYIGAGCGHLGDHRLASRQQLLQLGSACRATTNEKSAHVNHSEVDACCTCDVVGVHVCVQRELEGQTKRGDELGITTNG
jgi:hypothetical protein